MRRHRACRAATTCSSVPPLNALPASWPMGIDVSGRTILRWVQKFGPALRAEVQRHRRRVTTTWLVDETYVKILASGTTCIGASISTARSWIAGSRPRATCRLLKHSSGGRSAQPAVFPSTSSPQGRVLRECHSGHAPDAKHTATRFYNRVISTNRCERNHGYLKSRLRPMRGLKSLDCASRLLAALDAMQAIERGFVTASRTQRSHAGGRATCTLDTLLALSTGSVSACNRKQTVRHTAPLTTASFTPTSISENQRTN